LLRTYDGDTVFHQAVEDTQVLGQPAYDDLGYFRTGKVRRYGGTGHGASSLLAKQMGLLRNNGPRRL
jgi:hypothetical protein